MIRLLLLAVAALLVVAPAASAAVEPTVAQVRADDAWADGHRGAGVVVGVIDTGVHWEHPALKAAYRGWNGASATHAYNWHDAIHAGAANPCGFDAAAPCDDNGHGSAITGIAVGDDGGANQIGVAPGARWIGCRATNQGTGTPASFAECLQFMLAPTDAAGANPDPARRPDIVVMESCSAGDGCTSTSLHAELAALRDAGVLVVGAAGNGGSACATVTTTPGTSPSVLAAGAVNGSDVIASFSSRGPGLNGALAPGVVAPGVSVRSSTTAAGYGALSGTSLAAPSAAGVAALLLSSDAALRRRPAELQRLVEGSALPLTSGQGCGGLSATAVPNHTYGHGRVDAVAAIARRAAEPSVSIADSSSSESAGQAPVRLTLDRAGIEPLSVTWATAGGSATAGVDHDAAGGTVTFAPGEREKLVSVPVRGDADVERDETVQVALSSPVAGRIARGTGTLTILDDDAATVPPGAAPVGLLGPQADRVRPRITALRVAPLTVPRRGGGALVHLRLTEAARVTFGVQRRVGRRWRTVSGRLVRRHPAGASRFRFRGRLGRRTLGPGRYRLAATPVDLAGNRGTVRRAAFRIRRGR